MKDERVKCLLRVIPTLVLLGICVCVGNLVYTYICVPYEGIAKEDRVVEFISFGE